MPEIHATTGLVLGLGVLIGVTSSADTGHGAGGTEELLTALRRFATFGDCRDVEAYVSAT
jgi:hypothetical protein